MSESGIVNLDAASRAPVRGDFARALLEGLASRPRRVPCRFFYDRVGSALFTRICELPEYYATRTEMNLLRRHAREIAALMGNDVTLIEYGAGALTKVGLLLDALEAPHAYVPVDISGDYLCTMASELQRSRPGLTVQPIIADFTKSFGVPSSDTASRRVGFFPGSTIGNLDRKEAIAFLRSAALTLNGGGLLIGVDLVKDPAVLHAAYNDAAGVTEAFNKNILARANREVNADFDLDNFAHYAFYEPLLQRIEMHLMSLVEQSAFVCGRHIRFAEGETIHTENSYKYTVESFHALAREAGFGPRATWIDPAKLFSMHWLESGQGAGVVASSQDTTGICLRI